MRAEGSSAGRLICWWHPSPDSEGCPLPSARRQSATPPVCPLPARGLVPLPRLPLPPFHSPPPFHLRGWDIAAHRLHGAGWLHWHRKCWTSRLLPQRARMDISCVGASLLPMHGSSPGIKPHSTVLQDTSQAGLHFLI